MEFFKIINFFSLLALLAMITKFQAYFCFVSKQNKEIQNIIQIYWYKSICLIAMQQLYLKIPAFSVKLCLSEFIEYLKKKFYFYANFAWLFILTQIF